MKLKVIWLLLAVGCCAISAGTRGDEPKPAEPSAAKPATTPSSPGQAPAPSPAAPPKAPGGQPAAVPPVKAEESAALVPFPHPLISEVLYAVPTGAEGDANQDGTRDAAGDEFVELFNPHDKPINLKGYKIVDKSLGKGNALGFVFPECTLAPGQVVVVFNGCKSSIPQPVGDSTAAAAAVNPKFGGAFVFTMGVRSDRMSFANASDAVVVFAPSGEAVQVVTWGKVGMMHKALLTEDAPTTTKASVQREGNKGKLSVHQSQNGVSFSPGRFGPGLAAGPASPAGPAIAPETKPTKPESSKPVDKKKPKPTGK